MNLEIFLGLYYKGVIVHSRADQLLSQLLIEHFDTFPTQCRHINTCMKEFGTSNIIIDNMAAMRT